MSFYKTNTECSYTRKISMFALNIVATLAVYVLIVNFAPVQVSNIFLNPVAVVKGLQYAQEQSYEKEAKDSEKRFKELLATKKSEIFDQNAPFVGAKDAKVEIVVFSDYKCGYCKALSDVSEKILANEKYKGKVKFIIKEYPILGQASKILAIAAVESFKQNPQSFEKIHKALFTTNASSQGGISAAIRAMGGGNVEISETGEGATAIQKNISLGSELGIRGTPAIIIGEEIIGGLLPEADLEAKIDAQLAK